MFFDRRRCLRHNSTRGAKETAAFGPGPDYPARDVKVPGEAANVREIPKIVSLLLRGSNAFLIDAVIALVHE